MRKCKKWRIQPLIFCLFCYIFASARASLAVDQRSPEQASALSSALLQHAQDEVERIRALVDEGTLPKSSLEEAEARLADAQDQAILSETLYGQMRLQDMTEAQAHSMVEAAQRRVNRQSSIVVDRQKLLDAGILARTEFASFQDELEARQRVLALAQNRAQLLEELKQMAEVEERSERATLMPSLNDIMIRYDGNGVFALDDLPTISSEFEKRFHHPLPISAIGQTPVHQAMGLDHRNRVDVALNPEMAEGIWLRHLLEKLHVPYLAFRAAQAGAATAPHIHIGTGSTRLKLALR